MKVRTTDEAALKIAKSQLKRAQIELDNPSITERQRLKIAEEVTRRRRQVNLIANRVLCMKRKLKDAK